MEKLYKLMNRELKRKRNYINLTIYVTASDGTYIREKLGRDPESRDFVEALLEKLSKK